MQSVGLYDDGFPRTLKAWRIYAADAFTVSPGNLERVRSYILRQERNPAFYAGLISDVPSARFAKLKRDRRKGCVRITVLWICHR